MRNYKEFYIFFDARVLECSQLIRGGKEVKIRSGQAFYGQNIGILVNDSNSPRVPGDAGHSDTFTYPVRYQIADTSFMDMVAGSEESKKKLIEAAKKLKESGCRGIVADCGLMSLYQKVVAEQVDLPFVGSSLIQIPLIWIMLGKSSSIGIITGHSDFLKEEHLRQSGWDESIRIAIGGMQDKDHFREIVIEGGMELNPSKMEREVVEKATELKRTNPDIGAVILECSNLATYSRSVAEVLELPVFDTISAANLLQYGLCPPNYLK